MHASFNYGDRGKQRPSRAHLYMKLMNAKPLASPVSRSYAM